MVLADQFAVGTLDIRWSSVWRHTECDIGIGEPILGRPARRTTRSTTGCCSQQRFELRNVSLGQPQPACNTNQHGVFRWVDLSIRRHRHALQLQKELNERRSPATDCRKSIHCGIKIKIWLLPFAERGFGQTALFVIEAQHAEDLLNGIDLVACNDAIRFAESTHYSKDRSHQLCLRNAQPADNSPLQRFAGEIADNSTHEEPYWATCEQTDDCADECNCHS